MTRRRRGEAHVRLYRHELDSPAYRSLCPEARALLVEIRGLYSGRENRIHLSLRGMMQRLGVGRSRAEKARDQLLGRGFIQLLRPGSFNRKVRHAAEYALTNELLEPSRDGATAPKDFMRWQPPQKFTVLLTNTDGAAHQHRDPLWHPPKGPHGAGGRHRDVPKQGVHGAAHQHTDRVTKAPLLRAALDSGGEAQFRLLVAALALSADTQELAA